MTNPAMRTHMAPEELGDSLARLAWESFTDFLDRGPGPGDGVPGAWRARQPLEVEELLIYFLWVHTHVCQQSFAGRADAGLVRAALDAMHRAVFEDLEAQGTGREELPLFEQRLSARYTEYYAAAEGREEAVGALAARRIGGRAGATPALVAALAEATLAAAGPLRDFLDEVVLAP